MAFHHIAATHLFATQQQHVDLGQIAGQAPVVQLLMQLLVQLRMQLLGQLQPSPFQLSAQVGLCQSGLDSELLGLQHCPVSFEQ